MITKEDMDFFIKAKESYDNIASKIDDRFGTIVWTILRAFNCEKLGWFDYANRDYDNHSEGTGGTFEHGESIPIYFESNRHTTEECPAEIMFEYNGKTYDLFHDGRSASPNNSYYKSKEWPEPGFPVEFFWVDFENQSPWKELLEARDQQELEEKQAAEKEKAEAAAKRKAKKDALKKAKETMTPEELNALGLK